MAKINLEVSSFLKGAETEKILRGKSSLAITTAVAGGLGLFGSGGMFGASYDSGVMEVFSSCQEEAKKMRKVLTNWAIMR